MGCQMFKPCEVDRPRCWGTTRTTEIPSGKDQNIEQAIKQQKIIRKENVDQRNTKQKPKQVKASQVASQIEITEDAQCTVQVRRRCCMPATTRKPRSSKRACKAGLVPFYGERQLRSCGCAPVFLGIGLPQERRFSFWCSFETTEHGVPRPKGRPMFFSKVNLSASSLGQFAKKVT